jgi:hypothetical protein
MKEKGNFTRKEKKKEKRAAEDALQGRPSRGFIFKERI